MDVSWRWSLLVITVAFQVHAVAAQLGQWRMITTNAGISAMHAAVTPGVGSVVLLDHTNVGPTNITLPECRNTTYDRVLKYDCFAHSVIINPDNGAVRPLMIMTDTQCSSASFVADGSLQQTGGDVEGTKRTRSLSPACYNVEPISQRCDWVESNLTLKTERWYSTNVLLADGRQILFGGRGKHFSCEYAPPIKPISRYMPFLNMTTDSTTCNVSSDMCSYNTNGPNNWYPYAHLLPTTNHIYIFANRDSIIYDHWKNIVVRTFPRIPGNARNYPSAGSSVMLPLTWGNDYKKVEVMVCGGATNTTNITAPCSNTCGRMEVTSATANWTMEDMPIQRCMGDMVLTPDTNVLIINGVQTGYQGWKFATTAAKNPVLYEPAKPSGSRFTVLSGSAIARAYHSTANLLTDGSVMVAGSNTHQYYTFKRGNINPAVWFPTELSVEAFTPPYGAAVGGGRPTIVSVSQTVCKFNSTLSMDFYDDISGEGQDTFLFTMNSSPWSTHSFSHGQRVVTLKSLGITTTPGTDPNGVAVNARTASLAIPKYSSVLPPTYYMLWVVKNGNPSKACVWIRIIN